MLATPLLMSPIYVFWRDVCFRTQRAAVESRCATKLATHLAKNCLPRAEPSLTINTRDAVKQAGRVSEFLAMTQNYLPRRES